MRRFIAISVTAAALVTAGCGGDDSADTADTAPAPAGQTQQAADAPSADDLATATDRLADQIAGYARLLSEDPQTDVDQRLKDAEQRANQLSDQAQDQLQDSQPDAAKALRDVNDRLANAASELRDADSAEDVRNTLRGQLGPAVDDLTDAAGTVDGADTRRQLERTRDQLQKLGDAIAG